MSSGSQEKHAEVLGELVRELRQFTGLDASFNRAAAARMGMTVTDMQVMDLLRISGGASQITIRRPTGVAARVHLKGWASEFVFDDQTFNDMGNNVRVQSSGFEPTAPCYDIEVASSASMVTITSG